MLLISTITLSIIQFKTWKKVSILYNNNIELESDYSQLSTKCKELESNHLRLSAQYDELYEHFEEIIEIIIEEEPGQQLFE